MGNVRFKDGKVLFDSGAIAMDADCCCDDECPFPLTASLSLSGHSSCGCFGTRQVAVLEDGPLYRCNCGGGSPPNCSANSTCTTTTFCTPTTSGGTSCNPMTNCVPCQTTTYNLWNVFNYRARRELIVSGSATLSRCECTLSSSGWEAQYIGLTPWYLRHHNDRCTVESTESNGAVCAACSVAFCHTDWQIGCEMAVICDGTDVRVVNIRFKTLSGINVSGCDVRGSGTTCAACGNLANYCADWTLAAWTSNQPVISNTLTLASDITGCPWPGTGGTNHQFLPGNLQIMLAGTSLCA